MKIRPVEAELFRANRYDERNARAVVWLEWGDCIRDWPISWRSEQLVGDGWKMVCGCQAKVAASFWSYSKVR